MDHPRYIFTDPLVARQRSSSRDLSLDPLEAADHYLRELDGVQGPAYHRIDLKNPLFSRASECLQEFVDDRVGVILGSPVKRMEEEVVVYLLMGLLGDFKKNLYGLYTI